MMTLDEAMAWIADLFEESKESLQPDTPREDIAAWDSLGILSLMAGLDEEFEILLSEDELESLRSVSDILEILKRNGQLQDI